MNMRHSRLIGMACALGAVVLAPLAAQDLQEKLAAAKQAAALNQKALRSYSWVEKTELSLKGEVKNTKVDMCRYGPDGKVQKTPVVEPPPPEKQRGMKGKIIANKTAEMRLEGGCARQQYLPRRDAGRDECHRVDLRQARPRIAQVPGTPRPTTHAAC